MPPYPYGSLCLPMAYYGSQWLLLDPYGSPGSHACIWLPLAPNGLICLPMAPFGSLLFFLGPFILLSLAPLAYMAPYSSVWLPLAYMAINGSLVSMASYGFLRLLMVPYLPCQMQDKWMPSKEPCILLDYLYFLCLLKFIDFSINITGFSLNLLYFCFINFCISF
jgi:hypothetical protein